AESPDQRLASAGTLYAAGSLRVPWYPGLQAAGVRSEQDGDRHVEAGRPTSDEGMRGRRCTFIVVSEPRRSVTWANCSVPATCAQTTMTRVQAPPSAAHSRFTVRARKPFGEGADRSNCGRNPCWEPAGYLAGVSRVRQLAMAKDRCLGSRT